MDVGRGETRRLTTGTLAYLTCSSGVSWRIARLCLRGVRVSRFRRSPSASTHAQHPPRGFDLGQLDLDLGQGEESGGPARSAQAPHRFFILVRPLAGEIGTRHDTPAKLSREASSQISKVKSQGPRFKDRRAVTFPSYSCLPPVAMTHHTHQAPAQTTTKSPLISSPSFTRTPRTSLPCLIIPTTSFPGNTFPPNFCTLSRPTSVARPASAHPPIGFAYPTLSPNEPVLTSPGNLARMSDEEVTSWAEMPMERQLVYADETNFWPPGIVGCARAMTPDLQGDVFVSKAPLATSP